MALTLTQIQELTEKLNIILMKPFCFNDINIVLNYAARAKHAKNWVVATHYHPWFEFNYVSKGSLYTTINGKEFYIEAGQAYIIPPGVPHSHRHNNTGDDGICIRFSLNSTAKNRITDVLSVPRAYPFDVGLKMKLYGGILSTQAEFAAWLMQLFELWNEKEPKAEIMQNTFAAQVILYLEEYYRTKIKVADISRAMNTSYRTLARKFASETGMSVLDKLTEIRLDKAKQLLISTKLPIYDIAVKVGYENEFYFSKIFKDKINCSPKDYRKQYYINV